MFDVFKILKLDFLGEDWKDCYLKFHYLTIAEAEIWSKSDSSSKKNLELLSDKFIEGKAIRDGQTIEVSKENIGELPVEVLLKCITLLTTLEDDKKKDLNSPSDKPSEETNTPPPNL